MPPTPAQSVGTFDATSSTGGPGRSSGTRLVENPSYRVANLAENNYLYASFLRGNSQKTLPDLLITYVKDRDSPGLPPDQLRQKYTFVRPRNGDRRTKAVENYFLKLISCLILDHRTVSTASTKSQWLKTSCPRCRIEASKLFNQRTILKGGEQRNPPGKLKAVRFLGHLSSVSILVRTLMPQYVPIEADHIAMMALERGRRICGEQKR